MVEYLTTSMKTKINMKKQHDKTKTQLDNFPDKLSNGVQTQRLLDKNNVVSPDASKAILIKPGLWIVPNIKINNETDKKKFINDKIKQHKLS